VCVYVYVYVCVCVCVCVYVCVCVCLFVYSRVRVFKKSASCFTQAGKTKYIDYSNRTSKANT
jgi:hypothetical protein